MLGPAENLAALVASLRDVLLLVLGALITLLSTLLVQTRRAKDELRVRIFAGTVERLAELDDLVAKLDTHLGLQSVVPLMATIASSSNPAYSGPSRWSNEVDSAVARLKGLVHSFRRYPVLTLSVFTFVDAAERVFHLASLPPLFPDDAKTPDDRVAALHTGQIDLHNSTRRVQEVVDRIIANDLRSDLSFSGRMVAAIRTPLARFQVWWEGRQRTRSRRI